MTDILEDYSVDFLKNKLKTLEETTPKDKQSLVALLREIRSTCRSLKSSENRTKEEKLLQMQCTDFGAWSYNRSEQGFNLTYGYCFMRKQPWSGLKIIYWASIGGAIGYGISLLSLILASAVLIGVKTLHCPRNTIHMNLFGAFGLRSVMCLVIFFSFENDQLKTDASNSSGWCRTLVTIWNYAIISSYFWLFVEALYLINLIYISVFKESNSLYCILFGWTTPTLVMISWIIVKMKFDNYRCWFKYSNMKYAWILRGPISAILLINFLIFVFLIRTLYGKLQNNSLPQTIRYKKLAKSSLILMVVFGVDYFIISWPFFMTDLGYLSFFLAVCLATEHILNSVQGLLVALVYCFTTSEVQHELKRVWDRWRLNRRLSNPTNVRRSANVINLNRSCSRECSRQLVEFCIEENGTRL